MIELIVEFVFEAAIVFVIGSVAWLLGISFESAELLLGLSVLALGLWLAFRSALHDGRRRQRAASDAAAETPDRWYNAAMSKPFRFSIRRMLAAVALFCIAASLAAFAVSGTMRDQAAVAILTAAGTLSGSGVGLLLGRISLGAIVGTLLVAIPAGILLAIAGGVCP